MLAAELIKKKGGKVIAIEPIKSNYTILEKNISLNDFNNIVIEKCAISDENGTIQMIDTGSQSTINYSINSTENVICKRLDYILNKNNIESVDILMVDVEGAELPVLRSFPWGKIKIPYILCEMHPYNWGLFNYNGDDFMRFLNEHNLICIDMYFERYNSFKQKDYIGPCLLTPIK